MILIDVTQALTADLQLAASLFPGTVGFPARTVTAAIDADEIHFRITFTSAAPQQGARVAGGDFTVGVRHFGVTAGVVQARHGAEQRQAQRIEQGTFTGAGRPGDREQPGTGERFGGEINFERTCQRSEVLQANGENLHGCSPSICTSCSSSAGEVLERLLIDLVAIVVEPGATE